MDVIPAYDQLQRDFYAMANTTTLPPICRVAAHSAYLMTRKYYSRLEECDAYFLSIGKPFPCLTAGQRLNACYLYSHVSRPQADVVLQQRLVSRGRHADTGHSSVPLRREIQDPFGGLASWCCGLRNRSSNNFRPFRGSPPMASEPATPARAHRC